MLRWPTAHFLAEEHALEWADWVLGPSPTLPRGPPDGGSAMDDPHGEDLPAFIPRGAMKTTGGLVVEMHEPNESVRLCCPRQDLAAGSLRPGGGSAPRRGAENTGNYRGNRGGGVLKTSVITVEIVVGSA